jgi:hypothetical protein
MKKKTLELNSERCLLHVCLPSHSILFRIEIELILGKISFRLIDGSLSMLRDYFFLKWYRWGIVNDKLDNFMQHYTVQFKHSIEKPVYFFPL